MLCGETMESDLPFVSQQSLDGQGVSLMNIFAELRKLREENARLKGLLTRHGIIWKDVCSLGQTVPSTEKEQPVPSKTCPNVEQMPARPAEYGV